MATCMQAHVQASKHAQTPPAKNEAEEQRSRGACGLLAGFQHNKLTCKQACPATPYLLVLAAVVVIVVVVVVQRVEGKRSKNLLVFTHKSEERGGRERERGGEGARERQRERQREGGGRERQRER